MAILKTLLDEEILTKQERAVLRSIYRAHALSEGLDVLNKIKNSLRDETASEGGRTQEEIQTLDKIIYLRQRIIRVLNDTKVPNSPLKEKDPQTSTEPE